MNEREQIAWLYRRVGFGLHPGQLDELTARGVRAALDALVDPDRAGVAVAPDPWAAIDYAGFEPDKADPSARRDITVQTIAAWLVAMAESPRPFDEWVRWFWHGHFVSTLRVVKYPQVMVQQLRLFGREGLGDFRSLLRAVTIDPAMLIYLDGVTNKKGAVNENYGREVLELFALGIGNYTEADVRAGAEALTGWRVERGTIADEAAVRFEPRRHDDTPKQYLGQSGVHDVDTVVDAIVAHDACAPFVTRTLARAILGPAVEDALVARWADDFARSGLQLRPLVRTILEAGLDGASTPLVQAPVPWLTSMIKACGVRPDQALGAVAEKGLVPSGQVPMDAPNVAGWPGGRNWLSSSTTVARANMATGLATLTPLDAPLRSAARGADAPALADRLGLPGGFQPATVDALAGLRGRDPKGDLTLAVAMAAPDLVVI